MCRLRIALLAGFAAAACTPAQAADAPESWSAPYEKRIAPTEFASGWYIRGDIGYRMNAIDGASTNVPTAIPLTNARIDDTFMIGGGFGFKWGWFRSDFTADYGVRAKVEADGPGFAPLYSAKLDATTLLVNAYADLGTWAGFTPYVGAGIGTTMMSVKGLSDRSAPGLTPTDLTPNEQSARTWSLSWAAMAGVSYRLTEQLHIDVGYRYLQLGDAVSGANPAFREVDFRDLTAQEIRVGLRFRID